MENFKRTGGAAHCFHGDASGSIGPIFALLAIPLLGMAFAAFDYSRAQGVQTSLQVAIDTAAQAAAQKLGGPRQDVEQAVSGYLKANLPAGFKDLPYQVNYGPNEQSVSISISGRIPTTMIAIAGVRSMDISVSTSANKPAEPPAESATSEGFSNGRTPQVLSGPSMSGADAEALQKTLGLQHPPSEAEVREAERQVREIMRELNSGGGNAEAQLRDLMREFR